MDFEIRADGSLHIEGYVNAVERDSRAVVCPECGKCVEQIVAGAFGDALRAAPDVAMLVNHDRGRKIGSTSEGNLTLCEDNIGLRAAAEITDSEVIEKARRGLLRGWSFGFKARDTDIERRAGNLPRRRVKALDIFEVSIIDDRFSPCYAGTSIEMRAEGEEEFVETRFNPYYDPNDGRFTSAAGGNLNFVYAGKGTKGQNHDVDTAYHRYRIAMRQKEFWTDVVEKNEENRDKYIAEKMLEYGAENTNAKMLAEKNYEANYGKAYAADLAERNRWIKAGFELEKEYQNARRNEHAELKQQYYDLIKGKKGAADEKYFMNMFEPSDALLKKRIEQAKASSRAEPAVNADYIARYNKSVLGGYRVRAKMLGVMTHGEEQRGNGPNFIKGDNGKLAGSRPSGNKSSENSEKGVDKSQNSGIIEDEEVIGRSVGAKSKNYNVYDFETEKYYKFVEGTRIQNPKVFAGKNGVKPLNPEVAEGLADQIGGKAENWQHAKGIGYIDFNGEERKAEVHWFQEETQGKHDFKVKEWLD